MEYILKLREDYSIKKETMKTKVCKFCKLEVTMDAKVCANCQTSQTTASVCLVIVVIIVLITLSFTMCSEDSDANKSAESSATAVV